MIGWHGIKQAWRWIAGAGLVAALFLWDRIRYRKGRQDERREYRSDDLERAQHIRDEASDARRSGIDDPDKQLREHGRLRD